jgi:hypothetical protein
LFWGGVIVFLATIAVVAIVSLHEEKERRVVIGPVITMVIGALVLCGGAAWYFWPQKEGAFSTISDQEKFRRMIVTTRLRDEYLKTQSQPDPMIQSGLENPPADWFNRKLKALGESWKIQSEIQVSTEQGLFVECHHVTFPIKVAENGRTYALNLNAFPIEGGGGGIAEYSGAPNSEMKLGQEILTAQRCTVTNHGSKPLVNVTLGLYLVFQEQIKDKDIPNASRSGDVVLARPWRIDVRKIDPFPAGQFEFYIWNMTTHFAQVSFLGSATAEYIGSSERFKFNVSSSNPYPIHVEPRHEPSADSKSPPAPSPPAPAPPNKQEKK